METTETVTPEPKRQSVKYSHVEGLVTITLPNTELADTVDLNSLPDNIKAELLFYGFKQKTADYKANEKLKGADKYEAVLDCVERFIEGEFNQKKTESEKVSFEDRLTAWLVMPVEQREAVKPIIGEALFAKLEKASKEYEEEDSDEDLNE